MANQNHKVRVLRLGPDGQEHDIKHIPQSALSSECWGVQLWGTLQCNECEFRDTKDCGGQQIRTTGKNEKGFKVGRHGLEV